MSGHYVQLCPNPLRFEPVTKENSVFFDEANRQVWMFIILLSYKKNQAIQGSYDLPKNGDVK